MTSLYCILARAADTGVIFRRGPSKQTQLIGWNLKTHAFEPGQWFKGQIYARKSDLSPDGTKLVYFAAKHHGELPTWVAVSSPPYLTAHVLWHTLGTWNDLSLFETDSILALATYRDDSSLEPASGFAVPRHLQVKHKPWPGFFYRLADHDRLIRDGWTVHAGDPVYGRKSSEQGQLAVYRKPVSGGTRTASLEMSARSETKITYALRDDFGSFYDLAADWAEVRGEDVLYSQGGRLLRIRLSKSGKQMECRPAVELGDFSDMKFKPIEAPA
jgi:hypothetical protein